MDDYDYDSIEGKHYRDMPENHVKSMVEDKDDLNEQDSNGNTMLHKMVKYHENAKMIIELAQAGADMNIRNEAGYTPLHLAIKYRTDTEILKVLLEHGADVMARSGNEYSKEYTPLHLAAECSENSYVIYILERHRKSRVKRNDFINARAEYGQTPIHCAALMNKNPKVFIELILLGADVNVRDDQDSTPLHLAVEWGSRESVLYLLALGADARAKNKRGETPDACMGDNYIGSRAKEALSNAMYPDSRE